MTRWQGRQNCKKREESGNWFCADCESVTNELLSLANAKRGDEKARVSFGGSLGAKVGKEEIWGLPSGWLRSLCEGV